MVRATGTHTLKTWKLSGLKRSELNARLDIENDPDTQALAASIMANGILQDPAVRDDGTIIYGTRRVIAAGPTGLTEVVFRTYPKGMNVRQEHTLRIIENLERKDLNAIEKATELRAFVDMQVGKGKQKAAAAAPGVSDATLSIRLPARQHQNENAPDAQGAFSLCRPSPASDTNSQAGQLKLLQRRSPAAADRRRRFESHGDCSTIPFPASLLRPVAELFLQVSF